MEELVLAVDVSAPGDGVTDDDGHHFLFDEGHHGLHELGFLHFVAVQTAHEVLTRMTHDLAGQRKVAQLVEGARIEFEGTLVLELANDVVLHQFERCLRIDEVVVEDLLERDQGVVGFLFEDLVAIARQCWIEVGGAFFPEFSETRAADLCIVRQHLLAALELTGDAFRLIHKQHHDVEDWLFEMRGVGRFREITAQPDHFIKEHLQALHLHLGAGEAIEDRAVLLLRFEKFANEDAHHLAVAHHAALGFELLGFRAVEQRADHNRLSCDAAHFADEVRVRALACARCATEQDQLLWKAQLLAAIVFFQLLPDVVEDELGIFDFQICGSGRFGGGFVGGGRHCWAYPKERDLPSPGLGLGELFQSGTWQVPLLVKDAPCYATALASSLSHSVYSPSFRRALAGFRRM